MVNFVSREWRQRMVTFPSQNEKLRHLEPFLAKRMSARKTKSSRWLSISPSSNTNKIFLIYCIGISAARLSAMFAAVHVVSIAYSGIWPTQTQFC